jgi:hypothetical protein
LLTAHAVNMSDLYSTPAALRIAPKRPVANAIQPIKSAYFFAKINIGDSLSRCREAKQKKRSPQKGFAPFWVNGNDLPAEQALALIF